MSNEVTNNLQRLAELAEHQHEQLDARIRKRERLQLARAQVTIRRLRDRLADATDQAKDDAIAIAALKRINDDNAGARWHRDLLVDSLMKMQSRLDQLKDTADKVKHLPAAYPVYSENASAAGPNERFLSVKDVRDLNAAWDAIARSLPLPVSQPSFAEAWPDKPTTVGDFGPTVGEAIENMRSY